MPLVTDPTLRGRLERLQAWSEAAYARLAPLMGVRRRAGFIRECHGDMHLGNMAEVDGEVAIFDGIEFNPNLRWIDVMSEVAFLCMDLEHRGRPDYAWRFLNGYLERTGDYEGLALLRYYQAYRAMVRTKISAIRLAQPGLSTAEADAARAALLGYLTLAEGYARPAQPFLIITHGPSGTGKTRLAGNLCERLGAVRLRSDVERKRLENLPPEARSGSALEAGLYSAAMTEATYARLAALARMVLLAGIPAVVDATFLARAQRDRLRAVAAQQGVPFQILNLQASIQSLRNRVADRVRHGEDASEAGLTVLERQLKTLRPLDPDEAAATLTIDTEGQVAVEELAQRLHDAIAPEPPRA